MKIKYGSHLKTNLSRELGIVFYKDVLPEVTILTLTVGLYWWFLEIEVPI